MCYIYIPKMAEIDPEEHRLTSQDTPETNGSPTSEKADDNDNVFPSSLASEELKLALNKEATEEELTKAIARCKDLVLDSEQCSLERKWLVRHLIELRLRLQECKDALVDPQHPRNKSSGVSKRSVRGHHLHLQPLLRNPINKYCDHCTGPIWCVVQAWYVCEDCGYSCHHKCISSIVRECAHVVVTERGTYELEICPEVGLSAQKYQCAECKASLPLDNQWAEPRRCDYNGLYYCSGCHWGSLAVIPARVVHNWDFSPYPVCQASLQQLRVTSNRPLINMEKLNPLMFSFVHELDLVRRLRQELNGMRKYLLICRSAKEDHLLLKKVEIPHLVETINMYSLQDLVDTESGELPHKLQLLVEEFSNHIRVKCVICRGRGHICGVCSNVGELFPFDSNVYICNECSAVLHKSCYNRTKKCPKCERIKSRKQKEQLCLESDEVDIGEEISY